MATSTANTSYKTLADKFFNKMKDYDFANMDEDTAYEIAIGYIEPACNQYQSATIDLSDRDDELQEFNFIMDSNAMDTLVNYMVIEYLDSAYLRTGQMLKARLTTSDFHSLNQYNQLAKVMELRNSLKAENDQLAINRSYRDSSIFDTVKNRKKV